jgi:hypothetical protein
MASDDQILVSVSGLPQPTVDRVSNLPDLTSMFGAVVFNVIEAEKFDVPLATAGATDVAAAVVRECREPVPTKARLAVFGIADPAPGVHAFGPLQIELSDRLGQATLWTTLRVGKRPSLDATGLVLQYAGVVLLPRRTHQAVLAIG